WTTHIRCRTDTRSRRTPARAFTTCRTTPCMTRRWLKSGSPVKESHRPTDSTRQGNRAGLGPLAASDLADHRDDLAQHGGVVTRDGVESRIVWHQPNLATGSLERFDGCLAVDHRCHDVAVVGHVLLTDHHPVAVADRGVDHRFTDHPEQEQRALPDE